MSIDIGGKIRKMRLSKEISQNILAKKAGIAQSTLSYIESGEKHPKFETLACICQGLGIGVFELLEYGENMASAKKLEEKIAAVSFKPCKAIHGGEEELQKTLYEAYLNKGIARST
jgi:transcriptional regulator with XRE-family HTH domain